MKGLFTNRKAQQNTIAAVGSIAIILLVVAVIIGLNNTILEKIKKTSDDNAASFGNISIVWAGNDTAINLGIDERLTGGATVFNGTGGDNDIPNKDWVIVVSNRTIIFHNTTNQTWDTDNLVVDPIALIGSAAFNISSFGVDGQLQLVEFVPTIAIVAIGAILIGILLLMFGRRRTI